MAFPGLKNTKEFSQRTTGDYPTFAWGNNADTDPNVMTFKGAINRTALSFAVLIVGAIVGWIVPVLLLPALIVGLVIGLIIAFKRVRNAATTLSYSFAEGVVLGAISMMYESMYGGIVSQAVLATLAVFVTVMVLTRMNVFYTTPRMTRIFIIASVGYLVFSLLNLVLMLCGVFPEGSMFGMRSGWVGVVIGILAVCLASYSLVADTEFIIQGVQNRIEKSWEWFAAFSLIATLVWLYLEIIRIIAILRN